MSNPPCTEHIWTIPLDVQGGGSLRICFFCDLAELVLPGHLGTIEGTITIPPPDGDE